ncbi:MAG: zinc ribbon domain-containing protein [Clostridia bacterium]|nr:zinc ribbon domain-containing protein [Clostridia bacterium]
MFCFKCGKELPDGSKFCPECGTSQEQHVEAPAPAPVAAAPVTVNAPLTPKDTSKLTSTFKTPLFLVLTIFLSLVTVFYLTKVIDKLTPFKFGNVFLCVFDILALVFSIIATIASWKMYIKANDASLVGKLKGFPAILLVVSIFELIGNAVIGVIILAIFVMLAMAIEKIKEGTTDVGEVIKQFTSLLGEDSAELDELIKVLETLLEAGMAVMIIIGIVIAFLFIFSFIQKLVMHKHLKGYYQRLSNFAETGIYDANMPNPKKRLYVFGVLFAIIGIYFTFFNNFITSLLGGWGVGLSMIAFAGYYFVSALYFNKVHASLSAE